MDETFTAHDLDHDGFLNWEEYTTMADTNPLFLRPLTLHTTAIIEARIKEETGRA